MIKLRKGQRIVSDADIDRIRELSAQNMVQADIANDLGLTPSTISKYQLKYKIPHMDRTEARRISVARKGGARIGERVRRPPMRASISA